MYIAAGTIDLSIPSCRSLKDKRRIIRSLMDRLRHRLHLSVSEVDAQDTWRRAVIGWCSVSGNLATLKELEAKVRKAVEGIPEVEAFELDSECVKWGD